MVSNTMLHGSPAQLRPAGKCMALVGSQRSSGASMTGSGAAPRASCAFRSGSWRGASLWPSARQHTQPRRNRAIRTRAARNPLEESIAQGGDINVNLRSEAEAPWRQDQFALLKQDAGPDHVPLLCVWHRYADPDAFKLAWDWLCRSLRIVMFSFFCVSATVGAVIATSQVIAALSQAQDALPLDDVATVRRLPQRIADLQLAYRSDGGPPDAEAEHLGVGLHELPEICKMQHWPMRSVSQLLVLHLMGRRDGVLTTFLRSHNSVAGGGPGRHRLLRVFAAARSEGARQTGALTPLCMLFHLLESGSCTVCLTGAKPRS